METPSSMFQIVEILQCVLFCVIYVCLQCLIVCQLGESVCIHLLSLMVVTVDCIDDDDDDVVVIDGCH